MPVDLALGYSTVATSALGFTIALAWNEAVSKTLASFFPPRSEKGAARATLAYAVIITLLVIAVVAVIDHTKRLAYKIGGAAANAVTGAAKSAGDMAADAVASEAGAFGGTAEGMRAGPRWQGGMIQLWEPPAT